MPFQPRERRINVGDKLVYNGAPRVRFGTVTPGNIYKSIGRRGPNIYIKDDNGAPVTFNWLHFSFAE